jgi:glycosyltransferase involved in cell wall biosynthesis
MTDCIIERGLPISVVIATLGGDVLRNTVEHLNRGTGIPTEILICIPESDAANAECISEIANVLVIKTRCRGQVAQRAVGLLKASCPYVMQLDDDVILPPDTLKGMLDVLIVKGPSNVVAPFFRVQPTGADSTRCHQGFRGFVASCYYTLICGASFGRKRFGSIASSGIGFGVPMSSGTMRIAESGWLPGGVVLCYKEDLILDNYYPFPGKAFSEDLIHSVLWRKQKNCSLWTVLDASALVEVTVESFEWKSVIGRYRAHAYVAKLVGGSVWRTRLWLFCYCLLNVGRLIVQN